MKRKLIVFSVLTVLACAAFVVIKQYTRVDNHLLHDVSFADETMNNVVVNLCHTRRIPVVLEGFEPATPSNWKDYYKINYSAKKTTLRQFLDAVLPESPYIWKTYGNVVHIISRELASRPGYQMDSVIERFSVRDADRNTAIKTALAQVKQDGVPETLEFYEFEYKTFNLQYASPKISIDMKHATLREVLDRINQKAGTCYEIDRNRRYDVSKKSDYGPIRLIIRVLDDSVDSQHPNHKPYNSADPEDISVKSHYWGCAGWVFSLLMLGVIVAFPYIMTVFSRFDKERVLAWRKFFAVIFACYVPVIILLYRLIQYYDPEKDADFARGLLHYGLLYFAYLAATIIAKKLLDLKLSWWKFIPLATVYYFTAVILLFFLSDSTLFCKNDCLTLGCPR